MLATKFSPRALSLTELCTQSTHGPAVAHRTRPRASPEPEEPAAYPLGGCLGRSRGRASAAEAHTNAAMTMMRPRVAAQLLALMAAGGAAAAGDGAPASLDGQRAASTSPGLRSKNASALAAAPQIRRLQAGGDADRLLAFNASGNGAGLGSWAPGSEPCGAGWASYGEGWRGVRCDAAGGSVREMCAPQPFLELRAVIVSLLSQAADWAAGTQSTGTPASPRTSARWPGSR
eukprot:COSAG04_NODE_6555_length_1305_cov_11.768657_3_plen_232_part_00